MKFSGLLAVAAALASAQVATANITACNANNCARAVTGTRPGKTPAVTSRQADCSSFMQATVYTQGNGSPVSTVYPTAVPSYATACSHEPEGPQSALSSACSCWGIGATTVTVAMQCNANNCARAVTGTRPGKTPSVTSREADCSSFLEATVLTDDAGYVVATEFPTALPTYAAVCSGEPDGPQAAYASACGCWGIKHSTTTAPAYEDCESEE